MFSLLLAKRTGKGKVELPVVGTLMWYHVICEEGTLIWRHCNIGNIAIADFRSTITKSNIFDEQIHFDIWRCL